MPRLEPSMQTYLHIIAVLMQLSSKASCLMISDAGVEKCRWPIQALWHFQHLSPPPSPALLPLSLQPKVAEVLESLVWHNYLAALAQAALLRITLCCTVHAVHCNAKQLGSA